MNNIEIFFAGKEYAFTLPSCWDECTPGQIFKLCSMSRTDIPDDELKLKSLFFLLPKRVSKILSERFLHLGRVAKKHRGMILEAAQDEAMDLTSDLGRMMDILDWIRGSYKLTVNPSPTLYVGKTLYFGSKNILEKVSYFEYAMIDSLMQQLNSASQEQRSEEADKIICSILAILYKPMGGSLTDVEIERRSKVFAKVRSEVKDAIFMCLVTSFESLAEQFPRLFVSNTDADQTEGSKYGHAGVILELAGGKFGDIEATKKTPLYTVLMHLDMMAEKAEKQQQNGN